MTFVAVKEPYRVCGFTGHVPGFKESIGVGYGKATHNLFLNLCLRQNVSRVTESYACKPDAKPLLPDTYKLKILNERVGHVDSIYNFPMTAGYDGHIPNTWSICGERFAIAAATGVAEFETRMGILRCGARNLAHRDLLASGHGLYRSRVTESMQPTTHYHAPLIPVVTTRARIDKQYESPEQHEAYSRDTPPHFMDCGDERKHITAKYGGHIPLLYRHFGHSNKVCTHDALCEYIEKKRRVKMNEWCPHERLRKFPPPLASFDNFSCPDLDYTIYKESGHMMPCYGGHIPGKKFAVGQSFGPAPKEWLLENRNVESLD